MAERASGRAETILVGCSDGVGNVAELIEAIDQANSDTDEDIIELGENCYYTLYVPYDTALNGLPPLTTDIIIEGNGAEIQRFPEAQPFGLLRITNRASVTLRNLTLCGLVSGYNLYFEVNSAPFTEHDIFQDPLFIDPAGLNYQLQAESSAIDAGLDRDVTMDLNGSGRPLGKGFDIGVYEFDPAAAEPGEDGTVYLPLVVK